MTEKEIMQMVREAWKKRVEELALKGKTKEKDACAFMQGVITALVCTGAMTVDRANQIGLLFLVGRGVQFLETWGDQK